MSSHAEPLEFVTAHPKRYPCSLEDKQRAEAMTRLLNHILTERYRASIKKIEEMMARWDKAGE